MDPIYIVIILLGISVLGVMLYLVPYLKKMAENKNVPVDVIFSSAEQITKIAETIAKNLNLSAETKGTMDIIIKSAQLAVKYAEQLYKSGQCKEEERKDKAIEFVKMALSDAGIVIDEEKERFIIAVIEASVYLLPKTHPEAE